MRPWNATSFLPAWPVKLSAPRFTVSWQAGLWRFRWVCATHLRRLWLQVGVDTWLPRDRPRLI
jgi:hypothetical protein